MKQGFTNASVDVAARAVDALGWASATLLEADVLGARQVVACAPDVEEINRRLGERLGPHTDPWALRCRLDLDPGFLTRPSPVRLIGALAVRRTWRSARTAAGVFTAFGPRAVVLPEYACTAEALMEAAVTGLGVVTWDESCARCLVPAGSHRMVRRTHVHRLVEETVWAQLGGTATREQLDQPVRCPPGDGRSAFRLPAST